MARWVAFRFQTQSRTVMDATGTYTEAHIQRLPLGMQFSAPDKSHAEAQALEWWPDYAEPWGEGICVESVADREVRGWGS